MSAHTAPGYTIIELLFVLLLMAALAGAAAPRFHTALDTLAVRGAADAFAAQAAQARALALARGGARLVIDTNAGTSWLEDPRAQRFPPELEYADFGASISVDGARAGRSDLAFDALGLGRMANRTIRFRRNSAERRLTFSSYGRAREW